MKEKYNCQLLSFLNSLILILMPGQVNPLQSGFNNLIKIKENLLGSVLKIIILSKDCAGLPLLMNYCIFLACFRDHLHYAYSLARLVRISN